MGLGLGSHAVTLTYASIADQDTITVHGIVLTCFTGSPVTELAQFKKETGASATATNLADLITAIFDSTTGLIQSGISASASSGVVTITGARSITTDNTSGFAISASSSSDEPPFSTDFDQWILDGQLDVADLSVNESLMAGDTGLMDTFDLTGDGSAVAIVKPTNFLRAVEVRAKIGSDSQLYRLRRVSTALMLDIREGRSTIQKVDAADGATKYWDVFDDKIQFSAAPVSGASMAQIIGIKAPQTTKSTESELPSHLQHYVEDYAIIQAWIQKQRPAMVQTLYQKYLAGIQILNSNYQAV